MELLSDSLLGGYTAFLFIPDEELDSLVSVSDGQSLFTLLVFLIALVSAVKQSSCLSDRRHLLHRVRECKYVMNPCIMTSYYQPLIIYQELVSAPV